ncbi:MAG: IMP cyclohydrolase [Myxococcota bacterium]|nr:IMP cyclohydrolase [Myxococcota bacterium]
MTATLAERAQANLSRHLAGNPYPGRGLVIGRASAGGWLQVYWTMGRSAGSRNRVFEAEGPVLRTLPADADSSSGDTSLTLYEAMLELPGIHLVTNGDQTGTVRDFLSRGEGFEAALGTREREHDAPNYTPRISGMLDLRSEAPALALSILRASEADPEQTDRVVFRPAPPPAGLGFGLTTYEGDGSPLPSFRGDPLWLPLDGDAEAVLETYWKALDEDNRVSLAVKPISADGQAGPIRIRNQYARS